MLRLSMFRSFLSPSSRVKDSSVKRSLEVRAVSHFANGMRRPLW